jgi:hypothetical protein
LRSIASALLWLFKAFPENSEVAFFGIYRIEQLQASILSMSKVRGCDATSSLIKRGSFLP